ncbi:leucyl/phenylalanyl-tRNA--protein transferase [Pedobacter yulinensis]|uniref:Leucyl/phenylalanyl-tRNA--protein transferase n=1 Tax=Pedobacter yulinensis TaxID=2126353 RepID=A0A2T3HRW6_9SPHI|nr:leucyl/phenylalanyl-tRNA--protein transferase [Pedobacter yulinensis]PST85210.1 leucyl/phenylalanyl-tRNA--protein transferase [Pedobacter yulinensis]
MIFKLDDENLQFPDPSWSEEDGLLAIGGDLSPARLLVAYQMGIFPWFSEDDPICWFSPSERCVIFPEKIYESKSMQRLGRSGILEVRVNTDFARVIDNCAMIHRPGAQGTWITADMRAAYKRLNELGHASSIETWKNGHLVGGLYGVTVNGVFCGESMFSQEPNASKAALIWLCRYGGYRLIDCQLPNEHLMSMGAEMISRKRFLEMLHS